jgi:hypothetical protein
MSQSGIDWIKTHKEQRLCGFGEKVADILDEISAATHGDGNISPEVWPCSFPRAQTRSPCILPPAPALGSSSPMASPVKGLVPCPYPTAKG